MQQKVSIQRQPLSSLLQLWPSSAGRRLPERGSRAPSGSTHTQIYHEMQKAMDIEMMDPGSRAEYTLRDHRSLQCNADDYERMAGVPSSKGACFRCAHHVNPEYARPRCPRLMPACAGQAHGCRRETPTLTGISACRGCRLQGHGGRGGQPRRHLLRGALPRPPQRARCPGEKGQAARVLWRRHHGCDRQVRLGSRNAHHVPMHAPPAVSRAPARAPRLPTPAVHLALTSTPHTRCLSCLPMRVPELVSTACPLGLRLRCCVSGGGTKIL
jgi:hypothetical protein